MSEPADERARPRTMSVAEALGWGVVGCGWVAQRYVAPAMAASANGRLVAACDPDEVARTAVAATAPGAVVTADLEGFLATPGLDAVYVATPNHLHRSLVEAAAAAGKAVLCEKPMATTTTDAKAMVDACAAAGVAYATAFDQRFHRAHRHLADMVADGALGTVTSVRITYACWLPPDWVSPAEGPVAADNWRIDVARAGGGALVDLAPHGLDLATMIVGEPIVEVTALRQHRIFDYGVDDGAALVGRFEGGALLVHHVAYCWPDALPRRVLEVVGTDAMVVATDTMGQTGGGRLEVIDARPSSSGAAGARREAVVADIDASPFRGSVEAFAAAVLDGRPFEFTPQGDLHTMALLATAGGLD